MSEFNVLDTREFDKFIANQGSFVTRYNELSKEYDTIIKTLLNEWKGKGADAFYSDSQKVRTNISGIQEILQTMCDTLIDCEKIYSECDSALKTSNEQAFKTE